MDNRILWARLVELDILMHDFIQEICEDWQWEVVKCQVDIWELLNEGESWLK